MKVSDEEIFRSMEGEITSEDRERTFALLQAWIKATEQLSGSNDIRTVFLACFNTITTMGPGWCRLASINLLKVAHELEKIEDEQVLH